MMNGKTPDRMVLALVHERAEYIRGGRHDRIMMLDEQLAARGYCVDNGGDLVELSETDLDSTPQKKAPVKSRKERADAKAPETAAEPKPKQVVKSEASGD